MSVDTEVVSMNTEATFGDSETVSEETEAMLGNSQTTADINGDDELMGMSLTSTLPFSGAAGMAGKFCGWSILSLDDEMLYVC